MQKSKVYIKTDGASLITRIEGGYIMSIIQDAVAWARRIAADDSHGYDQTNRWGADYD